MFFCVQTLYSVIRFFMPAKLQRRLTLPLFTFYGLGSILGAGVYALVGKVAGAAGFFTPVAFVVAAVVAVFTGFSYAELSARYPKSGGESIYTIHAFGIPALSTMVGLLGVFSAIVSVGVLTDAFVGYLQVFFHVTPWIATLLTVLIATAIAVRGIRESAFAASVFTLIEIGGLLLILWVGRAGLASFPAHIGDFVPPLDGVVWSGILTGAFIAFYAYIGFEDMANVAEEVKNPHHTLPLGILLAIAVSTLLYCAVATVAVLSLPAQELRTTDVPLALIYERTTGSSPVIITFIGLFAIANGILVQIILGSRILYGLSGRGWLPAFLHRVHPSTSTPLAATLVVAAAGLLFALWLPILRLAELTSFTVLVIYAFVNAACMRVKLRDPHPEGVRTFPIVFPLLGFIIIASFLIYRVREAVTIPAPRFETVRMSVPQGDLVLDMRDPREVCLDLQQERAGMHRCTLEAAKASQMEEECTDGMSIAGCFACEFTCPLL
ncbi:MAG: APC family permease [Candidatus Peribacteraceae bacterium]|nr:APC family permease [Candidatus Peribacteraceae bacterium]MDD5742233.1 APC family permease [Candidatus Peribacteraceae bacterium]